MGIVGLLRGRVLGVLLDAQPRPRRIEGFPRYYDGVAADYRSHAAVRSHSSRSAELQGR